MMSEYERNKGKLIESSWGEVLISFPNTAIDDLEWDTENTYTLINDKIYKIVWEVRGETDFPEFADVVENSDGSINFHTYHYNGGAHWTELVEDEFKKRGNS